MRKDKSQNPREIAVGKIPPLASLRKKQKAIFNHPSQVLQTSTGSQMSFNRLSLQPTQTENGRAALLYADQFVNNSIDIKHDRINTLLNETFQLTVRQRIYEEEGEDDDLGDNADDMKSPMGLFE